MHKQRYRWKTLLNKFLIPKNHEMANFTHTKKTDVLWLKVSYMQLGKEFWAICKYLFHMDHYIQY